MTTAKFYALTFRLGRRARIQGFDVRALLPSRTEWQVIKTRIGEALRLIELHSPVRFRHLQRDIRRIWVTGIPSRGVFVHDYALCLIDFDYAAATDTRTEELALTLVHEGMHARLRRCGFGYEEAIRARIERICIRSELSVARRFSDCSDIIESKEARLGWKDEEWSDETIRRDHFEHLNDLGWSGRLAYGISNFLTRKPWRRSNERCS